MKWCRSAPCPAHRHRRSPCGERGLKCVGRARAGCTPDGRSPCGERGLKLTFVGHILVLAVSLPVRGAWVEMATCPTTGLPTVRSLPVRGAWVEMARATGPSSGGLSLPVRGAWVEIAETQPGGLILRRRSPCGERGLKFPAYSHTQGGAGRSPCGERGLKFHVGGSRSITDRSLPVRGAWVEIRRGGDLYPRRRVAPRAGSVG